jgi:hypothetical protein
MANYEIPQRLARPPAVALHEERLDTGAAIGAGLFAGTVMLLMLVAFATVVYGESPWRLLRMIAATVRGPSALAPANDFDAGLVLMGTVMHFAFSTLYALALIGLTVECKRWMAPWLGLAFGIGLYFANLHGFTLLFPWFAELRTVDTFAAHAFYGLLLAQSYAAFSAPADND